MFPLNLGGLYTGLPGMPVFTDRLDQDHLPDEVKEAIENHKDSIHSPEDIRDIARDAYNRR